MSLEQLTELRAALTDRGDDDDFARWMSLVEAVTSSLGGDPRATPAEKRLISNLRREVSGLIRDIREASPSPGVTGPRITASQLSSLVAKRGTAADRHPQP